MHIKVNSYSSDELPLNHEAKQEGSSRLLVALGSGLMFWLSLIGFACWVMISSSLANDSSPNPSDPLVMKLYPDGTKVILRWSEVGKGVDSGSSHGGAPKIVAYDPAKDGVVPIGEQSRTNSAATTKVPMASSSQNSQNEVPAKDVVAGMPKDNSWYVGLQNGASFVQDVNLPYAELDTVYGTLGLNKALLNTGYRLDVPIGYRVNEWFSCEFAPGFTYNTYQSFQGTLNGVDKGTVAIGGSLVQVPLMVNGILTIPTNSALEPFLGGGLGALYGNSKVELGNLGYGDITLNTHSWAFAYSGLAGINYHIDQDISVGICYKFTGTGPQNWQGQDGGYTTHTLTQSAEVTATLRF